MKISEKDWNDYIARLARLNQTAGQQMRAYLEKHPEADTDTLIRYANALITKYGEGSAELACQMYDALAEAQGVTLPAAEPAEPAQYGEVARMVHATKDSPSQLQSGVSRLVKRAGADTTQKNAIRDGAEWAWVPHGDACPFCLTLASRGWQRASKNLLKKGHAEHIHSNCDCEFCVRFDRSSTVAGYDPEEYYRQYREAGSDVNALRRIDYAARKDEINAQKRAAYKARNNSRQIYHDELKGVVIPTSKMVEDIPLIKLPGMTDAQAQSLRKAHRAVLQAVIDSKTPGREAGCYILSDYSSTTPFVGHNQGNADFPEVPKDAIGTIHSHPSGGTFSVRDITNFASNGDLSIMTVVGNNGKVYVFQKTELFDVSGYVKYLSEEYEIHPDYKKTAENYVAFMEEILNGAQKYGFNYSAY